MVIFGRRSNKSVIPNNRGMADRANRQLENYAAIKAEHFQTSLGVDAPFFYFWHNSDGSIPCTCGAAGIGSNRDVVVGGETKFASNDQSGQLPTISVIMPSYESGATKTMFGDPLLTGKKSADLNTKLTVDSDDTIQYDDDDFIDDIDTVFDSSSSLEANDPLHLFDAKQIDCSICFGSGYIDAWNIHGGKRCVFDTTNAYDFYCERVDIVESKSQPNAMVALNDRASIYWSIKLPFVWDRILRINVYNGTDPIPAYKYSWKMQTPDNTISVVNEQNLEALNSTGYPIKLVLLLKETGLQITHAEIVFAFSEARRAQIPEIQQGYEQEFLDWNVSLSVELPPDLQISEGDYLTESKFRKIWKVSTITRKLTAGGTVYGLSADLRALHSFEKDFKLLSLFQTNYFTGNLIK